MRLKLVVFLVFSVVFKINALNFTWLKPAITKSRLWSFDTNLGCDLHGNIYICGKLDDSLFAGNKIISGFNVEKTGIFLAKYDSNGNIKWVKDLKLQNQLPQNETYNDFEFAVSQNGSCWICAWIDSFSGGGTVPVSGIIVKTDSAGNVQWEANSGFAGKIALDKDENLFVAGSFYDSVSFGRNQYFAAPGGPYVYLLKYNATGVLSMGKIAAAGVNIRDIAVRQDGKIFILSLPMYDSVSVGGKLIVDIPVFKHELLTCFNADLDINWTKRGLAKGGNTYKIATDRNDNVYFIGDVNGQDSIFGAVIGEQADDNFLYAGKMDSSGKILWVRSSGNIILKGKTRFKSFTTGEAMTVDTSGNLHIMGFSKKGQIKIAEHPVKDIGAFYVAYNSHGKLIRTFSIQSKQVIYDIRYAGKNRLYFYLYFDKSPTIGGIKRILKRKGRNDFYIGEI